MWLVAPDGGCVGTGNPRSSTAGMEQRGEPARAAARCGEEHDRPLAHSYGTDAATAGSTGWAHETALPACHDRPAMSQPPYTPSPLPLGSDGYPAAGGVDRRPAGAE